MNPYANLTEEPALHVTPRAPAGRPRHDSYHHPTQLRESDLRYLAELVDTMFEDAGKADRAKALSRAGYHPGSDDSVRALNSQILRRIDEADELESVLLACGMGHSRWVLTLAWLLAQPDARWKAVGAKLHGIALGVFGPRTPHTSAPINILNQQINTPNSQDASKPITFDVKAE